MIIDERFANEYLVPGTFWGSHYNVLFFNTPKNLFPEIKQKLDGTKNEEKDLTSCLIEIGPKEVEMLEHAISRLKTCVTIESTFEKDFPDYLVYSTYISLLVAKTFLEHNCVNLAMGENPEDYLKIINDTLKTLQSDDRNGSPVLNSCLQSSPLLETMLTFARFDKEELNFLIDGNIPAMLQQQINALISRRDLHIKLWTTERNLSSNKLYSGMAIQPAHDYIYEDMNNYIKSETEPNNE